MPMEQDGAPSPGRQQNQSIIIIKFENSIYFQQSGWTKINRFDCVCDKDIIDYHSYLLYIMMNAVDPSLARQILYSGKYSDDVCYITLCDDEEIIHRLFGFGSSREHPFQ